MRSFEFKDNSLWFALEDILTDLELSEKDLCVLNTEKPDYFRTLVDGTKIIHESGFYFLALFVSKAPEAQKLFDWVTGEVMPSIMTKGYYKKGENHEQIS